MCLYLKIHLRQRVGDLDYGCSIRELSPAYVVPPFSDPHWPKRHCRLSLYSFPLAALLRLSYNLLCLYFRMVVHVMTSCVGAHQVG